MKTRAINPTPWMQAFNMNHAIEVTGNSRTLYVSGQVSADATGALQHAGDLVGQFRLAWDNVKAALAEADMDPNQIVRLNIYTTVVDTFMAEAGELMTLMAEDGVQPVSTLLGVARLFDPEALIELEATAVG